MTVKSVTVWCPKVAVVGQMEQVFARDAFPAYREDTASPRLAMLPVQRKRTGKTKAKHDCRIS